MARSPPPSAISDHLAGTYSADRIVENLLASSDSALADAVRVVEDMDPEVVQQAEVVTAGDHGYESAAAAYPDTPFRPVPAPEDAPPAAGLRGEALTTMLLDLDRFERLLALGREHLAGVQIDVHVDDAGRPAERRRPERPQLFAHGVPRRLDPRRYGPRASAPRRPAAARASG